MENQETQGTLSTWTQNGVKNNTTQKTKTTSSTEQSKNRWMNIGVLIEKCKKSLKIPKE